MTDPDSPYVRHKNGGGRIGRYATVSPSCYIDGNSIIRGHCEIYSGDIIASELKGWCRVDGNSVVRESYFDGFISLSHHGEVENSELSGDIWVSKSFLSNCTIGCAQGQQVRIVEDSALKVVTGYGPLFVSNANIYNCEMSPFVRAYGGIWERSPKIRRSPYQFHCIESHIEGNLVIGCWDRPLDQWKQMVQIYQRIGNKLALASEAIQWDDGEILGGFEKMTPEELNWYARAIENWQG